MSTPTRDGWWQRTEDNWYGRHNRIMLTAVLSLALVVVVVLLLHLYARYALRCHQSTGRARTAADGISGGGGGAASLESPNAGLDPSVISSLPTFTYVSATVRTAEDGAPAAECAVCLCVLEEGEVARLLPNCKHVFHAACIDVWLQSRSTCPICRAEAEPVAVASAESKKLLETRMTDSAVAAAAGAAEAMPGLSKDQEGPSTSRLNASLRRMLSRGRSERRVQTDGVEDLERQ